MAQEQQRGPERPQGGTVFPNSSQVIVFDGNKGLNTKPARPAIDADECSLIENFVPLGKQNLRTLWGAGAPVFTAEHTIVAFGFGNISSTPYIVLFLADGSVKYRVLPSGTSGEIAPAGTITTPDPLTLGLSQYGNQYILICADQDNGYFLWDGTNLYQAGTLGPDVFISNSGAGYTGATSITMTAYTGAGAGLGSFAASVQNGTIASISITDPGSGYTYADAGYIAFSGGTTLGLATAVFTASVSAGAITSFTSVATGSGYVSPTAVAIGGGGGGSTISVTATGGAITGISLATVGGTPQGGQGYVTAPAVYITDTASFVPTARIEIMPFGIKGTCIETFQGHVWIGNGNKILYTAPGAAANFGPPDGGGAFQSSDSFLRVAFTGLRQSNGFLYLFGDSSLNTIANVTTTSATSSSPPITQFNNNNVDPQYGTPWPNTVLVFSRNIVFANTAGVFVSYGGAVVKVSDPLDRFFANMPPFPSGFKPSAALANIFGINVYMILLPVYGVNNTVANKLFCWNSKQWFTATQCYDPTPTSTIPLNLLQVAHLEIGSQLTAYGTDGTRVYPLFHAASQNLLKTVQSKLWDDPGYFSTKAARRLYGLFYYTDNTNGVVTISVDNGFGLSQSVAVNPSSPGTWSGSNFALTSASWSSMGAPATWTVGTTGTWSSGSLPASWSSGLLPATWGAPGGNTATWQGWGGTSAPATWTSNGAPAIWLANGNAILGPVTYSQGGQLMGLQLTTSARDMTLLSLTLINQTFAMNT